jgi:hypothetical protein
MKRAALALGLLLCVVIPSARLGAQTAPSRPEPSPGRPCLAEARDRATVAFKQGASREAARRQLEIAAAACLDPTLTPDAAHLVGTVNADRARFARDFFEGKLSLAAYRAALDDRRDKLARLLRDPNQQRELVEGDADGDLVPDRRDRCPGTPDGTPTDAQGCPLKLTPQDQDKRDERTLRATLAGARFLYNRSCDGAPAPRIPAPLEWGRGQQKKLGTQGFNLAVAKVSGQPAGCEIFYEIQFRFIDPNPGNPALPPAKIVTVVFSQAEDLLTDPARAVLPLPVGPPLSTARSEAREAMLRQYFRATWRVRAVNGSNVASKWSPFVTQGPASGGVGG